MCNGVESTAAARGASATQDDDADCELVSRCFRLDARGDQRLGSPAKPAASAQQPLRIDVARGGRFVIPAQAGPTQDSSFPTPVGLMSVLQRRLSDLALHAWRLAWIPGQARDDDRG